MTTQTSGGATRARRAALNFLVGGLTQVVALLLAFVSRGYLVAELGIGHVAVVAFVGNVVALISAVELGVGAAVTYALYGPLEHRDANEIRTVLWFCRFAYGVVLLLIVGLSALAWLGFPGFFERSNPGGAVPLGAVFVLLVCNSLAGLLFVEYRIFLVANQRSDLVGAVLTAALVVQSVFQVAFLSAGAGIEVYLGIQALASAVASCLLACYAHRSYPHLLENLGQPPRGWVDSARRIVRDVPPLAAYKLGAILLNATDSIVIVTVISATWAGVASNFSMLVNALSSVLMQALNGVGAGIGSLIAAGRQVQALEAFWKLQLLSAWLFGSVFVVFASVANELVTVWLGPSFVLPREAIVVLGLSFLVSGLNQVPSLFRTAYGYFGQAWFTPLLAGVLNVSISIVLAQYWGIVGVFVGTLIARSCTFGIVDPILVFRLAFRVSVARYYLSLLGLISASIAIYALANLLSALVEMGGAAGLLIHVAIVGIVSTVGHAALLIPFRPFRSAIAGGVSALVRRGSP